MKKSALVLAVILTLCAWEARAQTTNISEADKTAITNTALDYIEGFYEGNSERMQRALHPDLAKRIVRASNTQGQDKLDNMTAAVLIQATQGGSGKRIPKEKQIREVTILDAFGNAASVKIAAGLWIDYLHVAKFNGRWVIVNVLWEMIPNAQSKTTSTSNTTNAGKYAAYIGEYNSPLGVMVVSQEGDKLFADAGNQRVEFIPEKEADKFTAQPFNAGVSFIRDTTGKISGIKILMPDGNEINAIKVK